MTEDQKRHLEKRLLEERGRSMEKMKQLGAEIRDDADLAGELASIPQHLADRGSETIEEETDLMLLSTEGRRLDDINRALRKLYNEPEQFGTCEVCGNEIQFERLDLVPWARLCLDHQRAEETAG